MAESGNNVSQYNSGDDKLDKQIALWLKWDRNSKTHKFIEQLVEQKDWSTLQKRLMNRVEFGTAGLRGRMQAGFDSLNELVIVQTAQGISKYVLSRFPDKIDRSQRGIVIGYDGRYNSKRFAELSAAIFIQNGIKVWLYSRMVPTPFVPYAITQLKCLAGVMVTASHNPKDDNGYKVYWSNGAQIISPHDKDIQQAILNALEPQMTSWLTEILSTSHLLTDPYDQMFESYFTSVLKYLPAKCIQANSNTKLSFVYTAMHGVGYPFVRRAFETAKLKEPIAVVEQIEPDPDFPTVTFPNPEEGKSSLKLSIEKAEREGITTILANDPDADRLACAQKNAETGIWKIFTGNELGALLGWWAVEVYKEMHPGCSLQDCYLIASTVSSKILQSMSRVDGFNFEETLTGFKWMGNQAIDLMTEGKTVLFAFEEAIGFMFSTTVLDKDGVNAAMQLATMVCYLDVQGITLTQKLNEIYNKYGYHCTNNSYLFCYEARTVKKIFERLRHFQNDKPNTYPTSILNGKFRIKHVRDLTTGVDTSKPDNKAVLPVSASSQMITFTFENGLVITLRTSGTEPKIKYYAELCAKPEEKNWEQLRKTCDRMVEAIVEEFLQPKLNNLTARSE